MQGQASLFGRDHELQELRDALDRGVGLTLVLGDAGIGKSRLLREALGRDEAHTVLWASSGAEGTPEPFGVVLDLLEGLSSSNNEDASDLEGILYAAAQGVEVATRQVAARLRGILSEERNLVAVIEDIHAADELSHSVLAHLVRSAEADAIRHLWSFRSDVAPSPSLIRLLDVVSRQARQIELGPLDEQSVMNLAAQINPGLDESQLMSLVELSDGIPLFAQELAHATTGSEVEMPISLVLATSRRLEGLDDMSRKIVQAAAMFPVRIDVPLLARVASSSVDDVVIALRAATDRGLLTDRDGRTVFRHALVRDAVEESVIAAERQVVHLRIAEVLEDWAREGGVVAPGVLANERLAAGDLAGARRFGLEAGQAALRMGALTEARGFLERVAKNAPSGPELLQAELGLSEILHREGDSEGAAEKVRRCLVLLRDSGDHAAIGEALVRLASVYAITDPRTTIEVLDQVLGLFDENRTAEMFLRAFITKGYVLTRMLDDPETGMPYLTEGLEMARNGGATELQAIAHDGLAWCYEESGDVLQSEDHGRNACDLALKTDDYALIARTLSAQASHLGLHGNAEEALSLLAVARGRIGVEAVHLLQAVDHLRAWILWLAGRPADAEHLAALLESSRFARIYGRVIRVWAALERGEDQHARSIVQGWWTDLGGASVRSEAMDEIETLEGEHAQVALCEILLGLGAHSHESAIVDWAAAYDRACRTGRPDSAGLGSTLHARGLIKLGRFDEASQVLLVFDEDERMKLYPFRWAAALELRGLIERALGRPDRANDSFLSAAGVLNAAGNHSDRARCMRLAAETGIGTTGNEQRSKDLLLTARLAAAACGAIAEQNRIEEDLRSLGVRPRAGRPKGSGVARGEISPREKEVVVLLAAGASNAEIAARLFIAEKTVENHVARAQKRLGLLNRAGLAAWAAKNGYV